MTDEKKRMIDDQTKELIDKDILIGAEDKATLLKIISDAEELFSLPLSDVAEEREASWTKYTEYMSNYGKTLGSIKYNFFLTKEDYLFLKNVILSKTKYDRNNVFIGMIVRDDFFRKFDSEVIPTKTSLYKGDGTVPELFQIDINEITRISHLTSLYEVQGLTKEAESFFNIIRKIGDISKIFEVFKTKGDDINTKGGDWTMGFDVFDNPNGEVIVPEQV
jgi:hypothetical protein